MLALPNFEASVSPFVVDSNASDVVVADVLSQGTKKDGDIIAYASIRPNKK